MMHLVPDKRASFDILPHKKIQLQDKAKWAVITMWTKWELSQWGFLSCSLYSLGFSRPESKSPSPLSPLCLPFLPPSHPSRATRSLQARHFRRGEARRCARVSRRDFRRGTEQPQTEKERHVRREKKGSLAWYLKPHARLQNTNLK